MYAGRLFITGVLTAALVACASTTLDGSWTRPEMAGKRLSDPVLVVGIARDETVRRLYEDAMAERLGALGVKASASHSLLPGALGRESFERLTEAARRSGARHMLSTAVIDRDVEVSVTPDPMLYGGWAGYRGWYGHYWGFAYPARTDVRTYNVYVAQTSLTDVASDRIDWTARTRTTDPADVESEVKAFVDVIIGAMAKSGLVAPPPK
jgi:hypothetical protein